jgi:hypothetical protein
MVAPEALSAMDVGRCTCDSAISMPLHPYSWTYSSASRLAAHELLWPWLSLHNVAAVCRHLLSKGEFGSPLPVLLRAAAVSLSATATMMVCAVVAKGGSDAPTRSGRLAQATGGWHDWGALGMYWAAGAAWRMAADGAEVGLHYSAEEWW